MKLSTYLLYASLCFIWTDHRLSRVLFPGSSPLVAQGQEVNETIYEIAKNRGFTLFDLAATVGLAPILDDPTQNLTLLAPVNEAFAALHPSILDWIVSTPGLLRFVLRGHVIEEVVLEATLRQGGNWTALNLQLVFSDELNILPHSRLVDTDIPAANGVIHTMDRIVNIPTLTELLQSSAIALIFLFSDIFDTIAQLGGATVFLTDLLSFSVLSDFSPELANSIFTNPAYTLHLAELLTTHIYPGIVFSKDLFDGQVLTMVSGVNVTVFRDGNESIALAPEYLNETVSNAAVRNSDVLCVTDVVHQIVGVLIPPFLPKSLIDVAREETPVLYSFLVMAECEKTLVSTFGLMVFAPTDAAFAALNASTTEFLQTEVGKPTLQALLAYHVVPAVVPSVRIPEGDTMLTTLYRNTTVTVTRTGTTISVNGNAATVIGPDKLANNGIVHVIDTLLTLPANIPSPPPTEPSPDTAAPVDSPSRAADCFDAVYATASFGIFLTIMLS